LTEKEMDKFFIQEFNWRNESSRYGKVRKHDGLKLGQLTGSGTTNSLEFVACETFWRDLSLPKYYAHIKNHKKRDCHSKNKTVKNVQ
jgi:hypothetical protein